MPTTPMKRKLLHPKDPATEASKQEIIDLTGHTPQPRPPENAHSDDLPTVLDSGDEVGDAFDMDDYLADDEIEQLFPKLSENILLESSSETVAPCTRKHLTARETQREKIALHKSSPLSSYQSKGQTYKAGKTTAELSDGDFFFIKSIRKCAANIVYVRGYRLQRVRKVPGVDKKRNELAIILRVVKDDPRSPMEQGQEELSVEELGKIRALVFTNKLYPEKSHLDDPENKGQTVAFIESTGRLFCRLKFITTVDFSKYKAGGKPDEACLQFLDQHEASDGARIDGKDLRQAWRGDTINGGSCAGFLEGELAFDEKELEFVNTFAAPPSRQHSAPISRPFTNCRPGRSAANDDQPLTSGSKDRPILVDHKISTVANTPPPSPSPSSGASSVTLQDEDFQIYDLKRTLPSPPPLRQGSSDLDRPAVPQSNQIIDLTKDENSSLGIQKLSLQINLRPGDRSPRQYSFTESNASPPGLGRVKKRQRLCERRIYNASSIQSKIVNMSDQSFQPSSFSGSTEIEFANRLRPISSKSSCERSTDVGAGHQRRYTFGDAFCGAGGASRGAKMAGLRVVWGNDFDRNAIDSYKLNFYETECYIEAAHNFINIIGEEHKVDILHISPPCQIFSPAHTIPGKNDEMNQQTFFAVGELLKRTKPRIATLENTFGLMQNWPDHLAAAINFFTSFGYSVRWKILNFCEYGLPQARRRAFFIASCPGEPLPSFPEPTHSDDLDKQRLFCLKPFATINDAILQIPDGFENHDISESTMTKGPKMDGNKPLVRCITCNGGQNIHPSGTRNYTDREFACLQGFPLEHRFGKAGVKKQIGNAVPPNVAKVIFEHLVKELRKADGLE